MVQIEGALHGHFTDLTLARPFLAAEDAIGPIDGSRFLDIQKGYVLQFFARYLKRLPALMLGLAWTSVRRGAPGEPGHPRVS